MKRTHWPLLLCGLLVAGAQDLAGQVEVGRYQFTVMIGMQDYDGSSALESSLVGAIDASYYVAPNLAVGFFGQVSRPKTDEQFFPLVRLNFGDETELHQPAQIVTNYVFGLQARLSKSFSRLTPHAVGGIAYYAFNLAAEQNRSDESRDGLSFSLGAGATYGLSSSAGLSFEIRDVVLLDYDRDWFDLSDPLFSEPRFPQPGGEPPPKESTIHNLRLTVGFSYIPGGSR